MISPVNLLILLWVATSAAMVCTSFVKRRRRKAAESNRQEETSMATENRSATHEPPPVLIRAPVAVAALIPPLADHSRTVTNMLEGIVLPYDLTPVPSVVEDPDRHLVFLTTHSNASEVGTRFADELERIGFVLESVEHDQAIAVRGDDVVSMKIVPDADRVEIAGGPRYGAAGPGDVALETWIGRSTVPPSTLE